MDDCLVYFFTGFLDSGKTSCICSWLTNDNFKNRKSVVICTEEGDDIIIEPSCPHPADVETYNDHRMAMGFSLIGIKVPGTAILNPTCCGKTFPDYFAYLSEILM